MPKRGSWSTVVTLQLADSMRGASKVAYLNGCALQDDASLLFQAERYPRATALAVLADEEFSKAFLLVNCASQRRWDSVVFESLRRHSNKQGIAEGVRAYAAQLRDNARRVVESNRYAFLPAQPGVIPDKNQWEKIFAEVKNTFAKPGRDFLKQDALYVAVNEKAQVESNPSRVGRTVAEECMAEAAALRLIVEVHLGHPGAAEAWLGG